MVEYFAAALAVRNVKITRLY